MLPRSPGTGRRFGARAVLAAAMAAVLGWPAPAAAAEPAVSSAKAPIVEQEARRAGRPTGKDNEGAEDRRLRLRKALDELRRRQEAWRAGATGATGIRRKTADSIASRAASRARNQPQPISVPTATAATAPGHVGAPPGRIDAGPAGAPGYSPGYSSVPGDESGNARHRWAKPVRPPGGDGVITDGERALENERFRWMLPR